MPNEEISSDPFTTVSKTALAQFAETGRKVGEATLEARNELFKALEEMGRELVSCATAEAEISLKLSKKLTAAHSVPDALAAYQEWLNEEISARAENARRVMNHSQKLMDTGARLLSNGWSSVGASA
ncbi:MAG: phasin family protein [Xanthobacteraceae bacterium]